MAISDMLKTVYSGTAEELFGIVGKKLLNGEKLFVITANAEIFMYAQKDEETGKLIKRENVVMTPDGISIVKAMRSLGIPAKERVTGVDMAEGLLKLCGENGRCICLLGAKEEIVSALAKKIKLKYPKCELHYHNGYDGDKDEIMRSFAGYSPDLVLVALGVPAQERLIARHIDEFSKGVFVGVGGSFDVLSGKKQRAPAFFVKTNTEWIYRIAREPKRLKRFYDNNIMFMRQIKKERHGKA